MIRRGLIVLVLILGLVSGASAFVATPTATEVMVEYDEPVTNADGTPLQDLKETRIYYQMGSAAPTLAATVPATAPTGGGHIAQKVAVPVGPNQEADVTFWATAVDTSGNESVRSSTATVRIDRLPPAPPR
jgi:hypothetical protein